MKNNIFRNLRKIKACRILLTDQIKNHKFICT